jgi:hypothetical protein
MQVMAFPPICFNETELANTLYKVYLKMFLHENIGELFSKFDLLSLQNHSMPHYHRGSLASFLSFVKKRVVVDWEKLMCLFLELVEKDSNLALSKNYIQELYLQLHVLGVFTVQVLRAPLNRNTYAGSLKGLPTSHHIPEVVCITLKVPRAKVRVFTELPLLELGTPALHCLLESSHPYPGRPWQNLFAAIHLSFGNATFLGTRDHDDFKVDISEDKQRWKGSSDMFVSFYAPSWVIFQAPQATRVALGVLTTPQTAMTFTKVLGFEMKVYETTLGNEGNV